MEKYFYHNYLNQYWIYQNISLKVKIGNSWLATQMLVIFVELKIQNWTLLTQICSKCCCVSLYTVSLLVVHRLVFLFCSKPSSNLSSIKVSFCLSQKLVFVQEMMWNDMRLTCLSIVKKERMFYFPPNKCRYIVVLVMPLLKDVIHEVFWFWCYFCIGISIFQEANRCN